MRSEAWRKLLSVRPRESGGRNERRKEAPRWSAERRASRVMGRKAPRKRLARNVMACPMGVPPSTRTSLGAPPTPRFGLAKLKLRTPGADMRRGNERGCLKSELGCERVRRYRASCKEPTFTCRRIRSIVSGLLFTMKTATRTCEPSTRDIGLAGDLPATFELDDVRARNLLVEICSNAWAQRMGPAHVRATN